MKYIDERHFRLLWTVGCAISWYGAWMLMAASIKTAQENPISFVVDTAHAKWDTTFPAISVCEIDNMQRVYNAADRNIGPEQPPLISNINTGPGKLKIELTAPVEIHWHSSADVPYFNKLTAESTLAHPNSLKRRSLAIRETVNEPAVRDVPWQRRRCLYPHEGDLKLYKYYSYSACVVECRQLAALRFCNCSSHLLPSIDGHDTCNLKGLECLNKHYELLTVLRGRWSARNEDYVTCDCLPECHEPDINLVVEENVQINDPISKVEIMLEYLPVERYQRVVVRSSLELVVSVGGTAGLFVGASILSAVELIYFFTVKLGCLFKHHVEGRRARRKRHKRQDFVSWAWNRHNRAPRF
ncbi:hypothetical protein B566_EDAN016617 [Ephemera danica]|nr:hypothetical protein B566_EDAN016617 [Ephemera danica]